MASNSNSRRLLNAEDCTYYRALNYLFDKFREFKFSLMDVDEELRGPWLDELDHGSDICDIYSNVVPRIEENLERRIQQLQIDSNIFPCITQEDVVPVHVTPIKDLPILLDVPLVEVPAKTMLRHAPRVR